MPKGTPYSGEFKQNVVETMRAECLSFKETSKRFGIHGHHCIQDWERIYITEGAAGLYIDRRGQKSTGRPLKLSKQVEEDLLAENQRLRMEIDYLKKLNALVSKEEQQNRKHK